jgi:hypothetical protein
MERTISRLGTVPNVMSAQVKEKAGWLRSRFVDRDFAYQDWLIDDVQLRKLVAWPNGHVTGDVTPVQNDWAGPELAIASLRTLLGLDSGRDWDTKMPDGRVALLFCESCLDFGCGALTAELLINSKVAEWRNVGWQVDYEPLDLTRQDGPAISFVFDRNEYEKLLEGLIEIEQSRLAETK